MHRGPGGRKEWLFHGQANYRWGSVGHGVITDVRRDEVRRIRIGTLVPEMTVLQVWWAGAPWLTPFAAGGPRPVSVAGRDPITPAAGRRKTM
jgi:hypothetical protein